MKVSIILDGIEINGELSTLDKHVAHKMALDAMRRFLKADHPKIEKPASVRLLAHGLQKMEAIKEVHHYTGIGLKEAKDAVECTPWESGLMPKETATHFFWALLRIGCDAVVVPA